MGDRSTRLVAILDAPSQIEKARNLWTLWPGSRDSDIDFFLYIAGVRPEVLRPYVLVTNGGGFAGAMLIGRLEVRCLPIQFGYHNFRSCRLRIMNFVQGGLRGNTNPENIELFVRHILTSLRKGEFDLAVFEELPVDSHLYHAVRTMPGILERGFSPECRTHRCLHLPDSSEAFYKIIPAGHRQVYRRKARKLMKDFVGDVHIKCYRSVWELDEMFREMEKVAAKSYQRPLGFGFQDTPEMRGRCKLAASKGWLRVFILYVAGKPCAFWNTMVYGETLWGDHIGFDSAYSRYSPGMYLFLNVIGKLCDQRRNHGIGQIDFGRGDAEYKSVLSNLNYEAARQVQIYGRTLRGLGVQVFSAPVLFGHRFAKRVLLKAKLLARTKRLWRHRAITVTESQLG